MSEVTLYPPKQASQSDGTEDEFWTEDEHNRLLQVLSPNHAGFEP